MWTYYRMIFLEIYDMLNIAFLCKIERTHFWTKLCKENQPLRSFLLLIWLKYEIIKIRRTLVCDTYAIRNTFFYAKYNENLISGLARAEFLLRSIFFQLFTYCKTMTIKMHFNLVERLNTAFEELWVIFYLNMANLS